MTAPETFRHLDLDKRGAADVVVIILSALVAIMMILTLIGVVVIKLVHPEINMSKASEVIAGLMSTIVGALVGFVGGRAVGKAEANGAK